MAEKNLDTQIAEKEAEIVKLKAEQEKLKREAAHQDYPKYIKDPTDETGQRGQTANDPKEEKAIVASYEKAYAAAKKQRDLEKKIADLRAEADKAERDARDDVAAKSLKINVAETVATHKAEVAADKAAHAKGRK